MNWVEDTINRELREFIVMVAKSENVPYSVIGDLLEKPVIIQTDTITKKRKRKVPSKENRCRARLLKDGYENQCSHSSSVGHLCKIHEKGDLKYGLINEPIPLEHNYKFKVKLCANGDDSYESTEESDSDLDNVDGVGKRYRQDIFDLNLYPNTSEQLTRIKIGGGYYYEDRTSGCVYLEKDGNLFYVGKLKGNNISRF